MLIWEYLKTNTLDSFIETFINIHYIYEKMKIMNDIGFICRFIYYLICNVLETSLYPSTEFTE